MCEDVQGIHHPQSVEDIQAIIRNAYLQNRRIKVTATAGPKGTSASATGIVCSDDILIFTDLMDEQNPNFPLQLETFEGIDVVNAPPGTRLYDLGE